MKKTHPKSKIVICHKDSSYFKSVDSQLILQIVQYEEKYLMLEHIIKKDYLEEIFTVNYLFENVGTE